jgi:hypothetical protein
MPATVTMCSSAHELIAALPPDEIVGGRKGQGIFYLGIRIRQRINHSMSDEEPPANVCHSATARITKFEPAPKAI